MIPPTPVNQALDAFLAAHDEELIAFRRRLHSHPELSFQEHETTAAVRARLEVAGLRPAPLPTETGLQLDLGTGDGPIVMLRADIDALPMEDTKEVPYRSTVPGVCHACGHDVHTTVLLGAGLALSQLLDGQPGRVRLLFQPAEEIMPGGGAETLHDTAVMDDVAVAFAIHCDPGLEVGHVGLRTGPITSAADRLVISLKGPGGHTARPHLSSDLIHVVQDRRAVQRLGATARHDLLGRLEEQPHPAGQLVALGQLGQRETGAQQHRRVYVVAAGVGGTVHRGAVGHILGVWKRECVKVGP